MSLLLHVFGEPPAELHLGTPLRVLDAGMRKPLLFQLDGPGGAASWVLKAPHKERQQETGLVFELVGADVASWLGLATPAIGLARLPQTPLPTDDTATGLAAREIYERSAGRLAFCSRYLDHAPLVRSGDLDDLRSVPSSMQEDAIRLFALDVLLRHYDRTPNNSNALAYGERLVAIDHGLAFFRLGSIDESGAPLEADTDGEPTQLARHIAARVAAKRSDSPIWQEVALRVHALDDGAIGAMLDRVPDELDRSSSGVRLGMKAQVAAFLRARREAFDNILERARACLSR